MRDLSNFIFCRAFVRSNILPRYVNEMQNWTGNIKQFKRLALFAPCDFWEWVTRYIASQCQIVSNANFRLPLWLCCNSWGHCRKQKTQIKQLQFLSSFLAKKEMITPATGANPSEKSILYFNAAAYPIQIQFKPVKGNKSGEPLIRIRKVAHGQFFTSTVLKGNFMCYISSKNSVHVVLVLFTGKFS